MYIFIDNSHVKSIILQMVGIRQAQYQCIRTGSAINLVKHKVQSDWQFNLLKPGHHYDVIIIK